MATKQAQAPAQEQSDEAKAIAAKAQEQAKVREEVMSSLSFGELFPLVRRAAKWSDVLSAADRMAHAIEEGKYGSGDKPSAIARKVALVAPSVALEFRLSLASYSLSGRQANATQLAELAGKLPLLGTKGSLRDKAVTFGGIVLPPIVGEI